jgi:hypothetical protein
MSPSQVYLGVLKYHFANYVCEYNSRHGSLTPIARRAMYSMAKRMAANYASRHNYANGKIVSIPVWSLN